jgi:heme A synthase
MTLLRRLSLAALVLAYGHIVFGAIVRITGSGFGCGDHWPKCHGYWFPPLERMDLVIEVFHRYVAAALSAVIMALLVVAYRRRRAPGVGGRGGVLNAALLATVLVVAAALFGAVIVKLELQNRYVVVTHYVIALVMLGALLAAAVRAGALGASRLRAGDASPRTWRAARGGVIVAFVVLVMGALTANLPGAAESCMGFPHCRQWMRVNDGGLHVQLTHRVLAFLLFFHVMGGMIAAMRRQAAPVVTRAAQLAFAAIVLQILIAASLVEMRLPIALQSLHQAVGTVVWIAIVAFALLARRAALGPTVAVAPVEEPSPVAAVPRRPPSVAVIVARGADFF